MKVDVYFGLDNQVTAQAYDNNGVIFTYNGTVDDVCAALTRDFTALEERREALRTALARILYSIVTWD